MKSPKRHVLRLALLGGAAAATAMTLGAGPVAAHISCTEYVNPHGQTIPPAGSTTLPGPRGGQNEDGFYLLTFDIPPAQTPGYWVRVTDLGSGTIFGPYPRETVIKYTQAPGADPSQKKIGSSNGQAGAVFTHITGKGDFSLTAVWGPGPGNPAGATPGAVIGSSSGVPALIATCYVPPPPK
jgi:hypothetical protein